jgi:hypothetical protein
MFRILVDQEDADQQYIPIFPANFLVDAGQEA